MPHTLLAQRTLRIASRALRLGEESAFTVLTRAKRLESAGRDVLHLELGEPDFPTPAHIVDAGARALAGPGLDGQLLICHDLLGSFVGEIAPRFVKAYGDIGCRTELAFRTYVEEVRAGHFPGPEHCYPLDATVEASLQAARATRGRQAG